MMVITHSDFDPSSRFRLMQYFPRFAAAGWRVDHRPLWPSLYRDRLFKAGLLGRFEGRAMAALRRGKLLGDFAAAGRYDAIVIGRELPHLVRFLGRRNPRLIFDFDDAIYLGPSRGAIVELARCAAAVVVGNDLLAAAAREWTSRVRIIPTVVDTKQYARPSGHGGSPCRVGWLGSGYSIRETLFPHIAMLARLQEELGFDFTIMSRPRTVLPESSLQWRFVEWSPEAETNIARHFDIGIMPLVDTPGQRAKCGAKLLQYMAAGLPAVASPIGANRQIVTSGSDGFLAETPADWRRCLGALVEDSGLRRRLGEAARARVEADYSLDRWSTTWLGLLDEVARA
jgi:glycosyltransferase involved in cell wall biosynthesis